MAKFLTASQLYRLIQRELPEGVYQDGSPSGSFTAASVYSKAQVLESVYANLSKIYDNEFPQLSIDSLEKWEVKVFGQVGDSRLSVQARQDAVLAKLRAQNNISFLGIKAQLDLIFANAAQIEEDSQVVTPEWLLEFNTLDVDTYLAFTDSTAPTTDLTFDLVTWCGMRGGAWILEVSHLDVDTYLSALDPARAVGLDCALDYAAFGLTASQLADIQATAYTFEVRIHGHAGPRFLAYLDQQLKRIEPARSTHFIYNDFPGPVAP